MFMNTGIGKRKAVNIFVWNYIEQLKNIDELQHLYGNLKGRIYLIIEKNNENTG